MLGSDIFHAAQDFRVIRACKLGHDDPQDVRLLHAKAAGQEVRLIVQSFDCATDPLGQLFADRRLAVDHRGDGGD